MLLSIAVAAAGALASRRPAAAASPARRAASVPQGPRIVRLPSPDNPLVAIRLLFQVGAADDPTGKDGLAALTAAMLGAAGTQRRSWAEVLDALYPMAAAIDTYGDTDTFVFEGTVHRDNLAAFADLLAEQILTPRFAREDFTRHRQDALDFISKTLRGNDDEDLGKQALAALMFKGHPYGHPSAGTVAGLRAIRLDDVRRFYADMFTQDRLIVGVAGGYPDGFPESFAARFSALPAQGKPRKKLPPPPAHAGEVLIVEKDARANAVSMGHPLGITRADDDFYPLYLAGSYLGEHRTFNGLLDDRVATEARPELRRLRLCREFHPGRRNHVPADQYRAPIAAFRDLVASGGTASHSVCHSRRSCSSWTSWCARAFRPRACRPRASSCSTTWTCGRRTPHAASAMPSTLSSTARTSWPS